MKREAGRTRPSRFTVAVRQGLRKHSPSLLTRARDLSGCARVCLGYPAPRRQSIRRTRAVTTSTRSTAATGGSTPSCCRFAMSPPNNTNEIPAKVSADSAYRNAKENSDRQNARIEHDQALARVMNGVLRDDMQLCKQFKDDKEGVGRWLARKVFDLTYGQPHSPDQTAGSR